MAAKKGRQATRGSSKSWPAWVWVAIGLLLGVGLMLVVLGKDWAPLLRKKNLPQPNTAATAPQASEPAVADTSKNPWAGHVNYAASKGGMVAMTKSIARAYAGEGIYAFTVCPGFTVTGMVEEYIESRGGIASLGDLPIGRPASVGEIAETVRWLAVAAPPSATGTAIDVNGASFVR